VSLGVPPGGGCPVGRAVRTARCPQGGSPGYERSAPTNGCSHHRPISEIALGIPYRMALTARPAACGSAALANRCTRDAIELRWRDASANGISTKGQLKVAGRALFI
jgi:hypothetical protein